MTLESGAVTAPRVPSDDMIAKTTIPWLRLMREDSQAQRAVTRGLAARVPFLLAPELCEADWIFHRLWDVRPTTDFAVTMDGAELVELARRLGRVLISQDVALLDEERFPPDNSAGVIVVGPAWKHHLDEFLVTIVGLLGPVPALYRQVKIHGQDSGELRITLPAGRSRRVTRRYMVDAEGLPLLSDLSEVGHANGAEH